MMPFFKQIAVSIGGKWLKRAEKNPAFEFCLADQGETATNRPCFTRVNRTSAYDASITAPRISRFVLFQRQPAFVLFVWARIRRTVQFCLVAADATAQCWKSERTNKGKKLCLRKPGLSLRWLLSPSQGAWKPIFSVAQPTLLPAHSLQTRSAQTQPQQHLLVQPLVCCVTTLASAGQHANFFTDPAGSVTSIKRRRASALAAFLRSKDLTHV